MEKILKKMITGKKSKEYVRPNDVSNVWLFLFEKPN